jgi:hypothetical protein
MLRIRGKIHDEAMTEGMIQERPAGFLPLGIFFFFGVAMAAYAGITLLKPGTSLDWAWKLNPVAYAQLRPLAPIIAAPFALLSLLLLLAGIGWFRRRRWGWILGTAIIALNLAADLTHLAMGDWKSSVGVVIAGLLLVYMSRPAMRRFFA